MGKQEQDGRSLERAEPEPLDEEEYKVKDGRSAQESYPAIVTGKRLGNIPDRR